MIVASFTAFDDFAMSPTVAVPVKTSIELARPLGQYDALSIQAVLDQVDQIGTINVQIFHSADGIHFVAKNSGAEITQPLTVAGPNVFWGSDSGTSPSLAFVQIRAWFSGGTLKARLKLYVTARDAGATGPAGTVTAPGFRFLGVEHKG